MCGIVLLCGPKSVERLPHCLARLRHRGPDDQSLWSEGQIALGFNRLEINGRGACGRQPCRHGDLLGVVNGEIYNHRELEHTFGLQARECDVHVVLPLLELAGSRVIKLLDGFYSALVLHPSGLKVTTLRDHMGKKPLFLGGSGSELFFASELKAIDHVDWFRLLPRGVAEVELTSGRVMPVAGHTSLRPKEGLAELLENAVRKRMPRDDQPVGVFLSGGLDSSLIAAITSRLRDDVTYYVLGDSDCPDRVAAEFVASTLRLRDVRTVVPPPSGEMPALLRSVVFATESFNPSVVSNGLSTFLLAQAVHYDGIKVVLTGEGADEFFGGYHAFRESGPWREIRHQLISDMQFTELRRLDLSCMAHSVEARCPFLDRAIRAFSDELPYRELYDGGENKVVLRRAFQDLLPEVVLHRPKASLDVGSGVRRTVVQYLRRNGKSEREELMGIWQELYAQDATDAYFHSYPVFDGAISRRGASHR